MDERRPGARGRLRGSPESRGSSPAPARDRDARPRPPSRRAGPGDRRPRRRPPSDTQLAAGAKDPDGDLPAVGHQELHGKPLLQLELHSMEVDANPEMNQGGGTEHAVLERLHRLGHNHIPEAQPVAGHPDRHAGHLSPGDARLSDPLDALRKDARRGADAEPLDASLGQHRQLAPGVEEEQGPRQIVHRDPRHHLAAGEEEVLVGTEVPESCGRSREGDTLPGRSRSRAEKSLSR